MSIIKKIVLWFKHNRYKEYHLEMMLTEDHQWLVHNTIAKTLTERYLKAMSEDWYRQGFERSSTLRDRINCDPYDKTITAIDAMRDHRLNLAHILYDMLTNDQKRAFISGIRTGHDLSNSEIAEMLQIDRAELLALYVE